MDLRRWMFIAAGVASADPGLAAGQRLADWQVHTSALPDALTQGAAAAFWNAAGLSTGSHRAQVLVLNLHTPEVLETSGIAGAAALALERTVIALAFEHVGVNDITRTDDSPGGPEAETFNLGENHFTLAASHQVGSALSVGATARYARADLDQTGAVIGLGAGFRSQFSGLLRPVISAYAISEDDNVLWSAAAQVRLPPILGTAYGIDVAYGAQMDALARSPAQRMAARIDWIDRAAFSAGVSRETDEAGVHWAPILAANVQLNRYTLGMVRENLLNDFGATYTFRLQMDLGPQTALAR